MLFGVIWGFFSFYTAASRFGGLAPWYSAYKGEGEDGAITMQDRRIWRRGARKVFAVHMA